MFNQINVISSLYLPKYYFHKNAPIIFLIPFSKIIVAKNCRITHVTARLQEHVQLAQSTPLYCRVPKEIIKSITVLWKKKHQNAWISCKKRDLQIVLREIRVGQLMVRQVLRVDKRLIRVNRQVRRRLSWMGRWVLRVDKQVLRKDK